MNVQLARSGITPIYIKVEDKKKLKEAVDQAFSFSFGKEIIIEDFLEPVGCSSDTDCFSVDGKLKFVSFNSQLFDEEADNPFTPAAYYWPSTFSKEHEIELENEIQRLISLLHLGSSIYNVETRECKDGKSYIMECSPRGGGNRLAECLEKATGANLIENSVRAALDMEIKEIGSCNYDGYWAEVVLHSDITGSYKNLIIAEPIKEFIVEKDIWKSLGDRVNAFSGANRSIGTVIFRFENEDTMKEVMNNIRKYIRVEVIDY